MAEVFIPKVQVIGPLRNRHFALDKGGRVVEALSGRESRVVAGHGRLGQINFHPLPGLKLDASHLPKIARGAHVLLGDEGKPDYDSTLHHKTTVKKVTAERGNASERLPKDSGFGSPHERKKIQEIRKARELERQRMADTIEIERLRFMLDDERISAMQIGEPPRNDEKKGRAEQFIIAHGGNLGHRLDKSLPTSARMLHHETTTVNVFSYAE